jgi:hypothetical protein
MLDRCRHVSTRAWEKSEYQFPSRLAERAAPASLDMLARNHPPLGLRLYANRAVRPDYFLPLPEHGTGVLLEVERGKTTINNMDFLDFWKCHLCDHANHLSLLVPQELRQHEGMSPRREYNAVINRLSSFFEPRNYTNVRSLWILGY